VVAFELRAVEPVRHTISGPARQAWMATRIQGPEGALSLTDADWTVNSKPGLRLQPRQGPDEPGDDSVGIQQKPHGSWQNRRSENRSAWTRQQTRTSKQKPA
jgi:hypothetical protein